MFLLMSPRGDMFPEAEAVHWRNQGTSRQKFDMILLILGHLYPVFYGMCSNMHPIKVSE